jgi:hypothetical protein
MHKQRNRSSCFENAVLSSYKSTVLELEVVVLMFLWYGTTKFGKSQDRRVRPICPSSIWNFGLIFHDVIGS